MTESLPALEPLVVPSLRVGIERLLGPSDDDPGELAELELPVLELGFLYDGVPVPAADPRERFFLPDRRGVREVQRDRTFEERARRLLESFGAVELRCLEDYEPSVDSRADYLVRVDGDVHAYCSFAAYALPQLRALGWQVSIDEAYPYRVVAGDVPWYVELHPDEAAADWFGLELGVLVEGRRLSLLPALLDLLRRSPDDSSLGALLRGSSRFLAVPAGDGCWLPVPAERLRRVLGVLRDLYDGRTTPPLRWGERLRVPELRGLALAALDEAFASCPDKLRWRGDERMRERSRALAAGPVAPEPPPAGLQVELRPYQRQGLAWLQHLRENGVGGVLADDMGLGKTLQTIAHLLAEKEAGRMTRPSLVVAPTSLVRNWEREIARFAPSLRTVVFHGSGRRARAAALSDCDVVITTYGLLARDEEVFDGRRFYLLVLDEAQAIKNRRSQAHRSVCAIDAELRVCLTGTPIENGIDELVALFEFAVPGLLAVPAGPIAVDDQRLGELRRRVAPFVLRRVKSSVASELPPKTEIVRPIDLHDEQRELYESIRLAAHADVRRVILEKGLAASTVPVLGALMKLRQVCCHPQLVRVPAASKVTRSAKLDVLLELVSSQLADGRRILLFSQFTSMLALISEGLLGRGIRHLKLTGATTDRQGKVDAFQQGAADVFLISLKAGGTGLTLTRADTVIHYDPWWNPAVQSQATDRAHRIGQQAPVFVYNLIVAGSVEERMLQLQQRKRALADAILGTGTAGATFELADVEDLFAPLDD
jgi:superfamily II DNA or RNA helicase